MKFINKLLSAGAILGMLASPVKAENYFCYLEKPDNKRTCLSKNLNGYLIEKIVSKSNSSITTKYDSQTGKKWLEIMERDGIAIRKGYDLKGELTETRMYSDIGDRTMKRVYDKDNNLKYEYFDFGLIRPGTD